MRQPIGRTRGKPRQTEAPLLRTEEKADRIRQERRGMASWMQGVRFPIQTSECIFVLETYTPGGHMFQGFFVMLGTVMSRRQGRIMKQDKTEQDVSDGSVSSVCRRGNDLRRVRRPD
ncbi:hypothetical protein HK17_10830 [Acetobacter indonesiensis]|uniref:Uncharacterized protein n=1 Tax=Acetobacter indonesiensis TaxID=104101 RepID=A0A252AQH0_9PROT|nr:hypothetical protein HK17_10830 [Acetobacter indonesiensis]